MTTGAQVSEADAKAYYLSHSVNYTQPQTRVVRHILVKDKKTADKLYAQLKAGADFATLAKKFSQDPGLEVAGRPADDLQGPDRAGVRQGRVRAQDR